MMVKRKKTVIAAICMAVASVGFVAEVNASAPPQETQETSAPDLQNFHLAEIVVNGKRYIAGEYVRATSNIGILGEQDAMIHLSVLLQFLKKQLKILCPQLKV